MATPVLPYPDMDFTPLDILTAAEMDQMVANDQYLRDFCAGLADGSNLSDGVIQARKIDFTTLGVATAYTSALGSLSEDSKISMTNFTVNNGGYSLNNGGIKITTPGIYEIEAEMSGTVDANKGWLKITKNGSSNVVATGLNRNTAATSYNTVHISKIATSLSANDIIYLYTLDAINNLNGGLDDRIGTYITIKKVA